MPHHRLPSDTTATRKILPVKPRHPFECVALLLQGGGALGAYQGGVYQALSEAELEPDWVAGISIGAINAAIIAGNIPEQRVPKLRAFWESVSHDAMQHFPTTLTTMMTRNNSEHQALNWFSAVQTVLFGIPGFFQPRLITPWLEPHGSNAATSYCDTALLKATLENLIDFDRVNKGGMRFNVAAVNVTTGNFINFDNENYTIKPEHVMASGAIPPGFPPIEIDGEYYWDGGLVSNTPLQWVVESDAYMDTLVFQVDLWSADGAFPQNMADVLTRQKDIQFSSRTRANTDRFKEDQILRHTIASLLKQLPDSLLHLPEVAELTQLAHAKVYNIAHLIYHNKSYEGFAKDFEFSRLSMEAHWRSGYDDTINTLRHPEVLERPKNPEGIAVFDFSKERRAKQQS